MVVATVKSFLAEPFNKWLVLGLLVLGAAVLLFPQPQAQGTGDGNASFIHFFYLPTCPHCHEQMEQLNPVLEQKYGVKVISHDVSSSEGGPLFEKLCGERELRGLVPTTLIGDKTFVGYSAEIGAEIDAAVGECVKNGCDDPLTGQSCGAPQQQDFTLDIPFLGKTDLRSMSLPALAIILGIVDGFNPCAMWVLVYLIALVMGLDDRKRVWLIVGSFVLASGILYFLFMTAWLNAFLLIGYMRPVMVIVGLAALGGGILSIKEYWETRNKPLVCKVGDEEDKKKTISRMREIVSMPLTWATFFAIVALAFVVNSIEFVCSSAIPAIFTQVLALSHLSGLEYYGYILLYDVFFLLDDLIIFGLAAFAISNTDLGEKYARYCKGIGGAILLLLGLMLLFFPGMLR
ncbi:hypothetical protein COU36_00230 [Candidatus Micrarchaeota archaeon CG10_big_fil_rev_8_21_14_0_10_59_7]|nr:MAG: hypothetical protein COU36_00230 [Candidatus Micrarchaeota archaeon CG10_big_fil_rev_8_21_14_0_10_59_7]